MKGFDKMLSFGQRLKILRGESGMSQYDLAESLGVSAQSVSKWECDLYYPDVSLLLPLATVLGVSTDCLLGAGSDEKKDLEELQKEIDRIKRENSEHEYNNNSNYLEYLSRMEFLKKYPFNYHVKYLASYALFEFLRWGKQANRYSIPDAEFDKLYDAGVKMLTSIKDKDTDPSCQMWIRFQLIDYYNLNKEYDKAEATALELPESGLIRDHAVFGIECKKEDYLSMERHSDEIARISGTDYLRFMYWRAESIQLLGDDRRQEAIEAWKDYERTSAEYDNVFFKSWLIQEYDPYIPSPMDWHLDAIAHSSCSYLRAGDVESALSCLERSEKIAFEKYNEAKESGVDKARKDHLLREIKKIPEACCKNVFENGDNEFTRDGRFKACKARIDALD